MSAMLVGTTYRDQMVRLSPSTDEGRAAVKKYGIWFWRRPLAASGVMLIPIVDGVPRVAEFIIVPERDVSIVQASVGYGSAVQEGGSRGK